MLCFVDRTVVRMFRRRPFRVGQRALDLSTLQSRKHANQHWAWRRGFLQRLNMTRSLARAVLAFCLVLFIGVGIFASSVRASETSSYTYDALGRLVQVARSGTVNSGVSASYSYDPADNRTNVTVTGGMAPITLNPSSLPSGTVGAGYSQTITASGGTGAGYSYSVSAGTLPAGLSLSSAGALSGTPSAAGASSFTITATDSGAHTGSQSYALSINAAVSVSPGSLPGGTVGSAYSQTITASGGTGTGYSFSVSAGTLPAGLGLSSGGVLSGTPSAFGTSSFTIRATDSGGNSGSQSYSLAISAATLVLSPTGLPIGTVGAAYSQTITASGGTGTGYSYSVSAGTLPAGLSLSASGLLSGTPTTAATYSFTATATDSAGDSGSQAYNVTINAGVQPCAGVSFAIGNSEVVEGDTLVFTVTKSGSTSNNCSVNYATANGTAVAGTHYTATSGTTTFSATQTSATISVATIYIGRLSGIKTVYVNLSSPTGGATVTTSQGVGSIDAAGGGGCTRC